MIRIYEYSTLGAGSSNIVFGHRLVAANVPGPWILPEARLTGNTKKAHTNINARSIFRPNKKKLTY